jgi:hypothetical protein
MPSKQQHYRSLKLKAAIPRIGRRSNSLCNSRRSPQRLTVEATVFGIVSSKQQQKKARELTVEATVCAVCATAEKAHKD